MERGTDGGFEVTLAVITRKQFCKGAGAGKKGFSLLLINLRRENTGVCGLEKLLFLSAAHAGLMTYKCTLSTCCPWV